MQSWGSSLIGIGIMSFFLPFIGVQFKIVQALGAGGGFICIAIGCGLLVGGNWRENRRKQNGDSRVNFSKIHLPKGNIDERFFVRLHAFALGIGGNNKSTLNTLKQLHKKVYQNEASDIIVESVLNSFPEWSIDFDKEISRYSKYLSDSDKLTLIKSVYVLAFGDGEVTEEEKSILLNLSVVLGVEEEKLLDCFNSVNTRIRAA